jgi:hypothetical protein
MTPLLVLLALGGLVLIVVVLFHRKVEPHDEAIQRLARLVGAQRVWGESETSLKRRAVALSRWPHKKLEPELAWWATLWARLRAVRQ